MATKRQRVVALQYDPAQSTVAPKILGKGTGDAAERILAIALEEKIPLYRDPELVEVLSQLDMGSEIKPELYQAVAEVLIFIYKMNLKKRGAVTQSGSNLGLADLKKR